MCQELRKVHYICYLIQSYQLYNIGAIVTIIVDMKTLRLRKASTYQGHLAATKWSRQDLNSRVWALERLLLTAVSSWIYGWTAAGF